MKIPNWQEIKDIAASFELADITTLIEETASGVTFDDRLKADGVDEFIHIDKDKNFSVRTADECVN